MAEYDRSYSCPAWWLADLARTVGDQSHKPIIDRAKEIDGRGKSWDASRLSKLLANQNVTIELVLAISKAVGIAPPFFEATSADEARQFALFVEAIRPSSRRDSEEKSNPDRSSRLESVASALDQAVSQATEQTNSQTAAISSTHEGSPRDPRTRRAPRGRRASPRAKS